MDTYKEDPEILFHELSAHLSEVSQSPLTPLDADILKRAERSFDASTPGKSLWTILQAGESLLQTLQQDPYPLTRLLERVILLIPFDALKTSVTTTKLEEGLAAPSIPVQLLCLAYLTKASSTPSGAAFVATSSSLTACLISTWLSTESTEVADIALLTLTSLLAVDLPSTTTVLVTDSITTESAHGQGLFWRRLFHDPGVYALFFAWTTLNPSLSKHLQSTKKGKQQTTLSQARLFDFNARAAELDWTTITTSSLQEVEKVYLQKAPTDQPYGGLLRYAASSMIDPSDHLMDVLRQDFFMKLLNVIEQQSPHARISPRQLKAIKDGAGVEDEPENGPGGIHL